MKFEDFRIIRETKHFTVFEIDVVDELDEVLSALEILVSEGYTFIDRSADAYKGYIQIICRDRHKPDPVLKER